MAAFPDPGAYPEALALLPHLDGIRREALDLRDQMMCIDDGRAGDEQWSFAPLRAEEEDRTPAIDALAERLRLRAPLTVALAGAIEDLLAYGFSRLRPGATISTHQHQNPNVTVMLGLTGTAVVTVGGEQRVIAPGRLLAFDYTLPHSVQNDGRDDRLVLLLLFPRRPAPVLQHP